MADVEGTVEAVRKNRKGFKLDDGQWYSTFNECEVEKGDQVAFDFKTNGSFRNVKGQPKVTSKASGGGSSSSSSKGGPRGAFPIGPLDGQRSIVRQNALTNARELIVAVSALMGDIEIDSWTERQSLHDSLAQEIVRISKDFEAYTTGDIDREEAEEAYRKLSGED